MTILGPILMVGFMVGAIWLGQKPPKELNILVHDDTFQVSDAFNHIKNHDQYHLATYDKTGTKTYEQAQLDFKKNDHWDLLLYLPKHIVETKGGTGKILYKSPPNGRCIAYLEGLINEAVELTLLSNYNIDPTEYQQLKSKVYLDTVDIETNQDENLTGKTLIGFFFGLFIFMFIFMYGIQVMRGVIEEKTNRVIEIIVSSVKPFQLMMGKIFGIMLVGLTQFIFWVILTTTLFSAGASMFLPDDVFDAAYQADQMDQIAMGIETDTDKEKDMVSVFENEAYQLIFEQTNWGLLVGMFLFYFIAGYLLYAGIMAAIGAAVDSETDTQQFMLPAVAPLIFAYITAAMSIENPGSETIVWCSHIPFTAPISMLVRIATGSVAIWEVVVSAIMIIATFLGTTWIASKIYRTGILMYGKKASYKEMFKWLRYK